MIDRPQVDRHREGHAVHPRRRRTQALLADAMQEVHAWLDVGYEAAFDNVLRQRPLTLPAPPELVEAIHNRLH